MIKLLKKKYTLYAEEIDGVVSLNLFVIACLWDRTVFDGFVLFTTILLQKKFVFLMKEVYIR